MHELFKPAQALEWILYVANRLETADLHGVLKMGYFADKRHLERYGFAASGDSYCAMKYGPVGSGTFDLLKAARGDHSQFIPPSFYGVVEGHLEVKGDRVFPKRDANIDYLSPAAVACLDEAIRDYGHLNFTNRTDASHDAAWEKAWATSGRKEMPLLDIASTLPNAEQVIAHIRS